MTEVSVRNAVNFICLNKENKVLILKRSDDDKSSPNLWCFPGGSVDFGESLEVALFREVKEESNLDIKEFSFFQSLNVYNGKLISVYFYGYCKDESIVKVDFEHSDFAWIGLDEIKNYDFAFGMNRTLEEFFERND